ncbi:MAG: PilZ domain-containing protein [bacterium]
MKKRPSVIKILSYLYFISPVFIILQLMWAQKIGLHNIGDLRYSFNWHVWMMCLLTPFVGYGIWAVKEWGYYLLMGHSIFLFINNVVIYAVHYTVLPVWVVAVFNLAILGVIITFVRKEVKSPYFNPKVRWWENAARYYYKDMRILVKEFNTDKLLFQAGSFDVSETGVFVATDTDVKPGEKYSFELILLDKSMLFTDGEVVWTNPKEKGQFPKGFGCKFLASNMMFKKRIRYHLRDIKAKVREIRV